METSTLKTVLTELWSPVTNAPTGIKWTLFENGTYFVSEKPPSDWDEFVQINLTQCVRNTGTETGDFNFMGPDSRWDDKKVFFLSLPSFPGVWVALIEKIEEGNKITDEERISSMLEALEKDRTDRIVLACGEN